jgi:hypothetical protein
VRRVLPAVLGLAVGLAAGCLTRREITRRRVPSPRLEAAIRAALQEPGTAWLYPALGRVITALEDGETAEGITVRVRSAGGAEVACWLGRGETEPGRQARAEAGRG